MLIVMGPVLGVSVADLYAAAFGPGFMLAGIYIVYLLGRAFINPKLGPPVPHGRARPFGSVMLCGRWWSAWSRCSLLIAATLGSILAGLATPTEAAAIGASAPSCWLLLRQASPRRAASGGAHRPLRPRAWCCCWRSTSNIFGAVFARLGTANWITEAHARASAAAVLMLIVVLILIFLLGWPFEWPAIMLVFLPIFYPVVESA